MTPVDPIQPDPSAKTRTILVIVAAILLTLFICGSCVFDAGAALQVGKINQCIYPPHVCQP